jgi:putative FmdB family regulatory protein
MPTYEYSCPDGHDFERFYRKISDAASDVMCPVCGKPAIRKLSAGGFAFKGSGFYLTDYGKNAHRGTGETVAAGEKAGGEGGGDKVAASAPESKSDSKSDAKSDAKSDSKSESKESKPAESKSSEASAPKSASKPAESKPAAPSPKPDK